jgi:YHS domain-containing protein
MTKDPICGMEVDEATALHAERDGKPRTIMERTQ